MGLSLHYKTEGIIISELETIGRINGILQALKMNPGWSRILEEKARMFEAMASIAIEGTVISVEQARAITAGTQRDDIGEKERREFVGYHTALEYIKDYLHEPFSKKVLLSIHERIVNGDEQANPGRIRADQRSVVRNGKKVYTPPPPEHLGFLIDEFIQWFNNVSADTNLSPIVAAAICHFWFVWIHPFADGNGRTARLLTTFLLLRKRSEGVKYFALSDYYKVHLDEYYDALAKANRCDPEVAAMNYSGDLTPWIEFFVRSYREQMKEIEKVANGVLQHELRVNRLRNDGKITDRQEKVLSFLSEREKASYAELMGYLEVTQPRITQLLAPLRRAQLVLEKTLGRQKWFMLATPESEPDETMFKGKLKKHKRTKGVKKIADQGILPLFGRLD